MVDPEPHRCRRTDGKKWRCSRIVLPDQKYCERHMHRGCNRSRKPVEKSKVNTSLITKPSGKLDAKPASNTDSAISNPNLLGIQLIDTSSCTPSRSCIVHQGSGECESSFAPKPKVISFSSKTSVTSNNGSSLNIHKKDNLAKGHISNNIRIGSGGKGSIICDRNSIYTGIGFSPRSVLQGCNQLYPNDKSSIELEPGRCRRTDGKKWRCKNAVLPGQKYCPTHMHRGAKRCFVDREPVTPPNSAVANAGLRCSMATSNIQKGSCTFPNTNLSMSISASSTLLQCNEKNPSSSETGTDTTITDTLNEYSCASF